MAGNDGTLMIEDAQIVFRNFSGKEGMYNAEGDRNFCVLLDDGLAQDLIRDGWNVKELRAREEGDTPQKYIAISVKYRGRSGATVRPPVIVMITSKGRTSLDETECELLDWVDIAKVDLIVRPYEWAVSGKHGVKAYLKSLFITIAEDALALKYADLPDARDGVKAIGTGSEHEDVIDVESWDVDEDQKALGR